jgi:hypothetical protein
VVKKTGKYLMFGVVLLWSTLALGQNGTLSAKCSHTTVGLNEPFRVSFSTDMRGGNIVPPAMDDFLIVGGPFQSQQTQIINGAMSFQSEVSYQLIAKSEGSFKIGPATLNSKQGTLKSNILTIKVKAGAVKENRKSQQDKDGFQVDIITSQKEVYVGEPFVMILRAYWTNQVRNLDMVQSPNFEGVLQNNLEFKQQQRREIIDGKRVVVLDFDKKLLTPTQPGTLEGPDLKVSGQVQVPTGQRDLFGRQLMTYTNKIATAKIPAVKIKPLPSPKPEGFSGAVGKLDLSRELSRKEINGDESITIKIKISGTGNFNTISVPELIPPQGFDIYDPKFNENIKYTASGVSGFKELEYLLVPQFKGEFIVPEMRWTFFNTKTGTYEEVVLDEEKVEVLSGAELPASTDAKGSGNKREVQDIDSDIRYLHSVEEPHQKRNSVLVTVLLAALVGGLWILQGVRISGKSPSKQALLQREKKRVLSAFSSGEMDRFGILFNTLEARLLSRGLDKEHINLASLQQTYGENKGVQLNTLLERCQMAEYAPGGVGDDQWFIGEFKTVWEWM